ncbi:MAG: Inorganic triphosphatase [Burkholderia gladioli]|nr:MAG: Inorganic triphosphatase [Burkholderia gladioli]
MAIETEIKLALPDGAETVARRALDACAGSAGREIQLANVYYDTPDLALARAKSAIRVRLAPQGWLQTFKTIGSADNGLHTRHEWELPVAGDALDIDALLAACDVPAAAEALRAAAPSLAALFRTDFARTIWRVSRGGTTVEAALDLGEIVAEAQGENGVETRRAPIREVELELIDGDEAVLHTLAEELVAVVPGLAPDNQSKAQRGYRLRAA